jgi:hypothetical protein
MPEPLTPQSAPAPESPGKNSPGRPVFAPRPRRVAYRYTQAFWQQTQGQLIRATWGPRLLARLVELLVISVPFNLLYDFIFTFVPPEWLDLQLPALGRNVIFWLVFSLITTLTAGRSRTTFGKKLLNLRLAGPFNQPLPLPRLFLREFLVIYTITATYLAINQLLLNGPESLIQGLTFIYLPAILLAAGCLPLFRNPPRLTWIDQFFQTQVVIADPKKLIG